MIFNCSATKQAFGVNPRYVDHRDLNVVHDGAIMTMASGLRLPKVLSLVRKRAPLDALTPVSGANLRPVWMIETGDRLKKLQLLNLAVLWKFVVMQLTVGRHMVQLAMLYNDNCSITASYTLFSCSVVVVYGQGRSKIFRMPIYPMLNRWNANPMTPNPGLWLVESYEYSYEYWWEHISYAYLSNVKSYEYWWAEYFVQRQATPSTF